MTPSIKNWEIVDIYKDMFNLQYDTQKKDSVVVLYLFQDETANKTPKLDNASGESKALVQISKKFKKDSTDIRSFYNEKAIVRSSKGQTTHKSDNYIVVDKYVKQIIYTFLSLFLSFLSCHLLAAIKNIQFLSAFILDLNRLFQPVLHLFL